jgi:hypothetical protein
LLNRIAYAGARIVQRNFTATVVPGGLHRRAFGITIQAAVHLGTVRIPSISASVDALRSVAVTVAALRAD